MRSEPKTPWIGLPKGRERERELVVGGERVKQYFLNWVNVCPDQRPYLPKHLARAGVSEKGIRMEAPSTRDLIQILT